jgi:NitT/TauT family transport system permease protein
MKNTGRKSAGVTIGQFALLAAILIAMQILVDQGIVNKLYLASPTQIASELWSLIANNILPEHLWVTLQEFFVGFGFSVVLGILLGIVVATNPTFERFSQPYFSTLMSIPKVAIMPLITIWFGIGLESKSILIFSFAFFPVFYNTISGIKQTSENHLKVARVFEANNLQVMWKVLLPSALPTIFAGLKVAAATGFVGAIFSEMLSSKSGLGNLLTKASQLYKTGELFAIILLVTALSVGIIKLIEVIEKKIVLKWKTE